MVGGVDRLAADRWSAYVSIVILAISINSSSAEPTNVTTTSSAEKDSPTWLESNTAVTSLLPDEASAASYRR